MIFDLLFVIAIIIQLFYYIFFFNKFAFSNSKKIIRKDLPISVIICAKNESDNLTFFLPYIINQNYTNFEIILVNDHSTDNTLDVMQSFKGKNTTIKIVNLIDSISNKKNAITKGIHASNYEHLLFTDADCKPISKNWIREISTHFNNDKSIILGYGAYQKIENSWLNKLIRFETLLTAMQYFSYANIGLPYMGVGRNIAYTKSQFANANGFTNHQHIKSGDDDLFINQIATKDNTATCYTINSFTISEVHSSFKKWFYQKRRHISTATSYKPIHQFLLGLFYLSQFSFWFLGISLLFISNNWNFIFLLFLIRIIVQYFIFGISAKKLDEKDLFIFIPFLELFLVLIQIRIFIQNIFSKPKEW